MSARRQLVVTGVPVTTTIRAEPRAERLTLTGAPAIRERLAVYDAVARGVWRDETMQPLVVTAHLGTGVVCARLEELSLDGPLASAALESLLRGDYYRLPTPQSGDPLLYVPLPLGVEGPGADMIRDVHTGELTPHDAQPWWWMCSTPEPVGAVARETQHWHKRFDLQPENVRYLALPANGRIRINGGRYKSMRRPILVMSMLALRWWCFGHAEGMRELLNQVQAIGKHRDSGYGVVRRWEVETAPTDDKHTSLWTPDGGLAHPIPLSSLSWLGIGGVAAEDGWEEPPAVEWIGYRSPRWVASNETLCATGGRWRGNLP